MLRWNGRPDGTPRGRNRQGGGGRRGGSPVVRGGPAPAPHDWARSGVGRTRECPRLPPRSTALWIDCDTGIDDALALLLAAGDPAAELVGVSTVAGNCPLPQATENSLRVLELAGARRVPVSVGAAGPIAGTGADARHVHGEDGLGGCAGALPPARARPQAEHAAQALGRALRARPGQITLVATGPLTNLALALALDGGIARCARHVVVMGGAVVAPGNVGPTVEFNIAADPEAARAAFAAPWPLTLVGLDVTMEVRMGPAEAEALRAGAGPVAAFCAQALGAYMQAYERLGFRREAPMHDPLAVAVACDPALVSAVQLPIDVETRGELTRGMTVADLRVLARPTLLAGRRTVQVCRDVDAPAAIRRMMRAWGAASPGR